jgi:hypothetical protein
LDYFDGFLTGIFVSSLTHVNASTPQRVRKDLLKVQVRLHHFSAPNLQGTPHITKIRLVLMFHEVVPGHLSDLMSYSFPLKHAAAATMVTFSFFCQ